MTDLLKPATEPTTDANRFVRLVRVLGVNGYLPGWKQPAVIAEFQLLEIAPPELLQDFISVVERTVGTLPPVDKFPEFERWPVLPCIAATTFALLQRAGWPLFSAVELVKSELNRKRVALAFPSMQTHGQAVALALQETLALLHALATGAASNTDPAAGMAMRLKQLKELAPKGMNSLRFLEAAHAQGIPWKRLTGNVHQFGWGARARWLDSSFTDETSYISMRVARAKRATAEILRNAGVPVPAHGVAANAAQALQLAEQLGYPVVVKPANLDRGIRVFTYLTNRDEVARAFAAAAKLSQEVLVEKHIFGNDYRLQVFKGEVYWATHRIPAGVTGDGVSTVRMLVETLNADPGRGGPGSAGYKRIVLDQEADTWLKRQALTLDAIPDSGRYVRLHGAANITSGGTLEPVLEVAHPDNLALAARAANILRLDIAGVDLLIPDIRHSWLETGAAICEVNAQPQMSPHLPAELLPRLVKAQGRIPVLFVLGGTDADCAALFDGLPKDQSGFGFAGKHGVHIAGRQVAQCRLNGFQACTCLLDDPAVTAVVLHIGDPLILRTGSPVDSVDHLVLIGPLLQPESGAADWTLTLALAGRLATQSRKVWLLDDAPEWQRQPGLPSGATDVQIILEQLVQTFAACRMPL